MKFWQRAAVQLDKPEEVGTDTAAYMPLPGSGHVPSMQAGQDAMHVMYP